MTQCDELLKLLHKFEELFDGKLGTRKTYTVYIELEEDAELIFSLQYPVLKIHK